MTLRVEPNYLKENNILQINSPESKLVHKAKKIYWVLRRGSQIITTSDDINCVESTSLMNNGNNEPTEVDRVVTHVEYNKPIYNAPLIVI